MVARMGSLNIFMFIIALLCISMGFFGYLRSESRSKMLPTNESTVSVLIWTNECAPLCL